MKYFPFFLLLGRNIQGIFAWKVVQWIMVLSFREDEERFIRADSGTRPGLVRRYGVWINHLGANITILQPAVSVQITHRIWWFLLIKDSIKLYFFDGTCPNVLDKWQVWMLIDMFLKALSWAALIWLGQLFALALRAGAFLNGKWLILSPPALRVASSFIYMYHILFITLINIPLWSWMPFTISNIYPFLPMKIWASYCWRNPFLAALISLINTLLSWILCQDLPLR